MIINCFNSQDGINCKQLIHCCAKAVIVGRYRTQLAQPSSWRVTHPKKSKCLTWSIVNIVNGFTPLALSPVKFSANSSDAAKKYEKNDDFLCNICRHFLCFSLSYLPIINWFYLNSFDFLNSEIFSFHIMHYNCN